jgi:hypothetical protein
LCPFFIDLLILNVFSKTRSDIFNILIGWIALAQAISGVPEISCRLVLNGDVLCKKLLLVSQVAHFLITSSITFESLFSKELSPGPVAADDETHHECNCHETGDEKLHDCVMNGGAVICLVLVVNISVFSIAELVHGLAFPHLLCYDLAVIIPLAINFLRIWLFELDNGGSTKNFVLKGRIRIFIFIG